MRTHLLPFRPLCSGSIYAEHGLLVAMAIDLNFGAVVHLYETDLVLILGHPNRNRVGRDFFFGSRESRERNLAGAALFLAADPSS